MRMATVGEQILKAFEPEVAISIVHLGKTNIATTITKEIYFFLEKKHETWLDNDNGVIYLKRRRK